MRDEGQDRSKRTLKRESKIPTQARKSMFSPHSLPTESLATAKGRSLLNIYQEFHSICHLLCP